jgi:hypothetical protein
VPVGVAGVVVEGIREVECVPQALLEALEQLDKHPDHTDRSVRVDIHARTPDHRHAIEYRQRA